MVKNEKEIEEIKKSGQITALALLKSLKKIKPGVSTLELDQIAEEEILKLGAKPSFKTVDGYPHTICATVEDQVVHTPPTERKLVEGEIISIDAGAFFQGFHTDMARTVGVGKIEDFKKKFIAAGKTAFLEALKVAKVGNRIGDISYAIQNYIESQGFSVVRELTGHGVGRKLHEEPSIPCFGQKGQGELLKEGMTLAIEVIYTQGKSSLIFDSLDNWTVRTKDGSLGGLYEDTVLITKSGPIALTKIN